MLLDWIILRRADNIYHPNIPDDGTQRVRHH